MARYPGGSQFRLPRSEVAGRRSYYKARCARFVFAALPTPRPKRGRENLNGQVASGFGFWNTIAARYQPDADDIPRQSSTYGPALSGRAAHQRPGRRSRLSFSRLVLEGNGHRRRADVEEPFWSSASRRAMIELISKRATLCCRCVSGSTPSQVRPRFRHTISANSGRRSPQQSRSFTATPGRIEVGTFAPAWIALRGSRSAWAVTRGREQSRAFFGCRPAVYRPRLTWWHYRAALSQMGAPLAFEYPEAGPIQCARRRRVLPEFVALLVGLGSYTAAFIAEVVRAGRMSGFARPDRGGAGAGASVRAKTQRYITMPQAMRVIIPPLTNQYSNIPKELLASRSPSAIPISFRIFTERCSTIHARRSRSSSSPWRFCI